MCVILRQRQAIWEKGIDAQGAGVTVVSPDWLTGLQRNWGGRADVPVAGRRCSVLDFHLSFFDF